MRSEAPTEVPVDRESGSGGRTRTYDQAVNSRPPLNGDEAKNQSPNQSRAVVYRFFDLERRLLYVGLTSVGPARWVQHAAEKPWWPLVASVTVTHFATIEEADAAEQLAIEIERPTYNVVHRHRPRRRLVRPRRPAGAGSVFRRADGLWVAQVSRGPRGDRRVVRRYSTLRHIAEAALAALLA